MSVPLIVTYPPTRELSAVTEESITSSLGVRTPHHYRLGETIDELKEDLVDEQKEDLVDEQKVRLKSQNTVKIPSILTCCYGITILMIMHIVKN